MKFFSTILLTATAVSAISITHRIPAGASIVKAPIDLTERSGAHNLGWPHPGKDNWGNKLEPHRRKVTIRSSRNDTDDVSADFLWGINQANHGGLLYLEKGKTYVIGTKLDLPVMDDIYVKLDGEIKVRTSLFSLHFLGLTDIAVYRRYRILAGELLLLRLSEVNHLLGLEWKRHQDLRFRDSEWQWPGLVQWFRRQRNLGLFEYLLPTNSVSHG